MGSQRKRLRYLESLKSRDVLINISRLVWLLPVAYLIVLMVSGVFRVGKAFDISLESKLVQVAVVLFLYLGKALDGIMGRQKFVEESRKFRQANQISDEEEGPFDHLK